MMEKCFDEVILQAFLDNELALEQSQNVARHIADCDSCAILLAQVEEETSFTFNALEEEFNTLIPTNRLWTKINESIETQNRKASVWTRIWNFKLNTANIAAFASLLLIIGVVSTLLIVKNNNSSNDTAEIKPALTIETKPPVQINTTAKVDDSRQDIQTPNVVPVKELKLNNSANQPFRVEKANFVRTGPSQKTENKKPFISNPKPSSPQFLDGEESYINTIARLEKTVDGSKDEVLKPSARFAYEKDLAVVNDTITKMKQEVKKNPKNEGAKQVLFSSYQNKIELLNSVTQRSELMASMR